MIIKSRCSCGLYYQHYDWEKMNRCISCQWEVDNIGIQRGEVYLAGYAKRYQARAERKAKERKAKAAKFYYTANTDKINARRRKLREEKRQIWPDLEEIKTKPHS